MPGGELKAASFKPPVVSVLVLQLAAVNWRLAA